MVRKHNYTQTAIGDCGHVVLTWPQLLSATRWKNGRRVPEYICEECTEEKYGCYYGKDGMSVWVSAIVPETETDEENPKPKPPPKPKKKKAPVCTFCRKPHLYTECPLLIGQTKLGTDG